MYTLLLMAEILHHLGCMKPYKQWDKLPINWCRISAINSRTFYTARFIACAEVVSKPLRTKAPPRCTTCRSYHVCRNFRQNAMKKRFFNSSGKQIYHFIEANQPALKVMGASSDGFVFPRFCTVWSTSAAVPLMCRKKNKSVSHI